MEKFEVIVLVSGGLDSVVSLYYASKMYHVRLGLSFNYGSKHNSNEIPFAEHHCGVLNIPHNVINLDFMTKNFNSVLLENGGEIPEGHYESSNMKQTVVPFRNGIMLAIAGGMAESAGADGLIIAAHSGDHAIYPDCREIFLKPMSDAIRFGTYNEVEVIRPFVHMVKSDIVLKGKELGVDFSKTWSCYKGGSIHCGRCGTCVERKEAFINAGVEDPTEYIDREFYPVK